MTNRKCNRLKLNLEEKNKNIEIQKKKDEEDEKNLQLYKLCLKHDLDSIETKEDEEKLSIISESYGINNLDEAKDMFTKGKKIKFEKERKLDQEAYDRELEKSKVVGKDKYIGEIKENLDDYETNRTTNEKFANRKLSPESYIEELRENHNKIKSVEKIQNNYILIKT